jgi:hypothetical protein
MGIGALAAGQPPSPLGWGFALALASTWCDAVLFLSPPGQEALPWLSIVLAVLALVFVVRGLKQIFAAANRPSRKVWSSILVLVSLLLIGVSAFASFKSRAIAGFGGSAASWTKGARVRANGYTRSAGFVGRAILINAQ